MAILIGPCIGTTLSIWKYCGGNDVLEMIPGTLKTWEGHSLDTWPNGASQNYITICAKAKTNGIVA